jgi:uncharacterized protein (TIGR02466 family)
MEIVARPLFPTLVWTTLFDDREGFNKEMMKLAYGLREKDPAGVRKTNEMGWQSRNNIQDMAEFQPINDRILSVARTIAESQHFHPDLVFELEAWVNISVPGASNAVHIHPNCHLSGVYYIQIPPNCGSIYFRDPRIMSLMTRPAITAETVFTANEARMLPEEGRMYVFPSWLEHGVEVNRSDRDRISISFNVHIAPPARH